jgi:hypothetical protein
LKLEVDEEEQEISTEWFGEFDSNKAQTGEVHKSIYVTTNTPNGINQTLVFTGKIEGHKTLSVEKK